MNLLKRVSRGILWGQLGRAAEVGLFGLLSFMLARKMGPSSYGVFSLGASLVAFFGFLALVGIGQETLAKFVPEAAAGRYPGGAARLTAHLLSLRLAAIAVVCIGALLAGGRIEHRLGVTGFRHYLGILLLVFILRSIADLFSCVFSALLRLRVVAGGRVVVPATALLLVLVVAWQGESIDPGIAFRALAIGQCMGLAVILLAWQGCKLTVDPEFSGTPAPLRRVLSFGLYTWLAGLFIFVLSDRIDVLLLGWLLKDPKAVGWYAVGATLVFQSTGLTTAWLPLVGMSTLSNAYLEAGPAGLAQVGEALWKIIAVSLVPVMVFLVRFSKEVVVLLYSTQFVLSAPVVQTLGLLLGLSAIVGFGLQAGMLYILGHPKTACAIFAASAALNIVLAFPLIHRFGIVGAAAATGGAFLLFSLLSARVARARCRVRTPWSFLFKVVSASAAAAGVSLLLKPYILSSFAVAGFIWIGVLLLCLWLMKPLTRVDSQHLSRVSQPLGWLAGRLFVRVPTSE
jgi:O-antigen/teichoic acid export membrane protein